MLKLFLQFIFCLVLFQSCYGQANGKVIHKPNFIDSIKTAKQIEELIFKINKRYADFKVNEALKYSNDYSGINCKKISDSLKVKPWQIPDFDNNGLNDMLIVGNWSDPHIICILDKGNGNYEINPITRRSFQECTFPVVNNNRINYYFESHTDVGDRHKPRKLEQIVLVYQSGDFIEENPSPASYKIDKIEYSTTGCFGICPIFKMTINADRTASWLADRFNKVNGSEVKGNYTSIITEDKYSEIINLLNYIDFVKLKDSYAVDWTDDQSSTLTITYDNRKTKIITDYGLIGTYGLNRVYQMLFALRTNQKWTN